MLISSPRLASRAGCVVAAFTIMAGCVMVPRGTPSRYEAPMLPDTEVATIVTAGSGIGIYLVDGCIPLDRANYNVAGLKGPMPKDLRLLPGTHEVTFGLGMAGALTQVTTNMTVSAGERFTVTRRTIGYDMSISVEKE